MMLRSKGFDTVVPGWKFCRHCDEASRKLEESTTETEESEMEDIVEYNQELEVEEKRAKLNETLNMFDVSPLKTHGLQKRTQFSLAQEKLERSYERQKEAAAEVFDISSPEFSSPTGCSRKRIGKEGIG